MLWYNEFFVIAGEQADLGPCAFGAKTLSQIQYDGELSVTAYIILTVVLLGLISGLGWCFYRALTATDTTAKPQASEEVGDEPCASTDSPGQ